MALTFLDGSTPHASETWELGPGLSVSYDSDGTPVLSSGGGGGSPEAGYVEVGDSGTSPTLVTRLLFQGPTVSVSGGVATFNLDGRYMQLGSTLPWSQITGRPTTLLGYGIIDSYTRTQLQTAGQANINAGNVTSGDLPWTRILGGELRGDVVFWGGHTMGRERRGSQTDLEIRHSAIQSPVGGVLPHPNVKISHEVGAILTAPAATGQALQAFQHLSTSYPLAVFARANAGGGAFLSGRDAENLGVRRWEVQEHGQFVNWLTGTSEWAYATYQQGDTIPRWLVTGAGMMGWGLGSGSLDVNLYRGAADRLQTDDTFEAFALRINGQVAINSLREFLGRVPYETLIGPAGDLVVLGGAPGPAQLLHHPRIGSRQVLTATGGLGTEGYEWVTPDSLAYSLTGGAGIQVGGSSGSYTIALRLYDQVIGEEPGLIFRSTANGLALSVDFGSGPRQVAAGNHAHSWAEITGKPTLFPPSPHEHVIGQITGGSSPDLIAAGGSGGLSTPTGLAHPRAGARRILSAVGNAANPSYEWVTPDSTQYGVVGGQGIQVGTGSSTHTIGVRLYNGGLGDQSGLRFVGASPAIALAVDFGTGVDQVARGNHDHAGLYAPASHSHAWGAITGKPTLFPPSAHEHGIGSITGGLSPDLVAAGGTGGLSTPTGLAHPRAGARRILSAIGNAASAAYEWITPEAAQYGLSAGQGIQIGTGSGTHTIGVRLHDGGLGDQSGLRFTGSSPTIALAVDFGSGPDQVARGNHNHDGQYAGAGHSHAFSALTGTVGLAQLPAAVARRDQANVFTADQTLSNASWGIRGSASSGWDRSYSFWTSDGGVQLGGLGAYATASDLVRLYLALPGETQPARSSGLGIYVQPNGSVSIGKVSASHPLDVAGAVNASELRLGGVVAINALREFLGWVAHETIRGPAGNLLLLNGPTGATSLDHPRVGSRRILSATGGIGTEAYEWVTPDSVQYNVSAGQGIQVGSGSSSFTVGVRLHNGGVGDQSGLRFVGTNSALAINWGTGVDQVPRGNHTHSPGEVGAAPAAHNHDERYGLANQPLRTTDAPSFAGLYVGQDLLTGGFGARATSGAQDWDDVTNARSGQGYTLLNSSAANAPPGVSGFRHPFSFEYAQKNGTGGLTQFAIPYRTTTHSNRRIYYRSRYQGAWDPWTALATEEWADATFTKPGHQHDASDITGVPPMAIVTGGGTGGLTHQPHPAAGATRLLAATGGAGNPGYAWVTPDSVQYNISGGTGINVGSGSGNFVISLHLASGLGNEPGLIADANGLRVDFGSGPRQVAEGNHTHAQYALAARSIIAGSGLSGGGSLAADRTLSVAFGTSAGTVAQGNHNHALSSLTGSLPGDRLSGTIPLARMHADVATHSWSDGRYALGSGFTVGQNLRTTDGPAFDNLYLTRNGGTTTYPTATSWGDMQLRIRHQNQAIEMGVAGAENARRGWIIMRHNSVASFGHFYGTLHLQPLLDGMTWADLRGVGIGLNPSTHVALGTGLRVGLAAQFDSSIAVTGTSEFTGLVTMNNALFTGRPEYSDGTNTWPLAITMWGSGAPPSPAGIPPGTIYARI